MKIKSLPEYDRPMEKCLSLGPENLSDRELLALLINSGTKEKSAMEVAEELLTRDESGIRYLKDSSIEELMIVRGIGKVKAVRLAAAAELGKRIASMPLRQGVRIENDEDIAALFMEEMRYLKKEVFKALLLDSKGGIISADTVSVGELNSTVVHPREAFKQAVKRSAAAIVFIHNHPSGDPEPSNEDILTTRRLVECGKLLGINVIDHLIMGNGKYTSLRARGKI